MRYVMLTRTQNITKPEHQARRQRLQANAWCRSRRTPGRPDRIEKLRRTGYPAFAGYDDYLAVTHCYETGDSLTRRLEPLFGQQPHRGVGVHRLAPPAAPGLFGPPPAGPP